MAYDEASAARMRDALAGMEGISEKRMMGGLCFFANGNMIGAADQNEAGGPRFMFRVGKANEAEAAALPGGTKLIQGGRRMTGFFFVEGEDLSDEVFSQWLSLALSHALSLPAK